MPLRACSARATVGEDERDARERARRTLVAAISHDLRTPLASLRLLTDAIRDGVVDHGALEQMDFHVRWLESLVDDLFELSRIEAGDVDWPMEPVALRELVEETVEGMRGQAAAAQLRLACRVREATPPVRASPEKLQRVLFNLIDNALRHSPAGGTVIVEAAPGASPGEVAVWVADSGGGIPEEDRDRVFEPFFRGGAPPARPGGGAGLGLYICRAIVEAHGGQIGIVGTQTGTQVRILLRAA